MRCSNCGALNFDNVRHCSSCNSKFDENKQKVINTHSSQANISNSTNVVSKPNNRPWLFVILIVIAVSIPSFLDKLKETLQPFIEQISALESLDTLDFLNNNESKKTFVSHTVPIDLIITKKALSSYNTIYKHERKNKAFAQSDSGAWAWRANKSSIESAISSTLTACQAYIKKNKSEYPCKIIDLNGSFINSPESELFTHNNKASEDYENKKTRANTLYQKGKNFRKGYGESQNNKEAIKWFTAAGNLGHMAAQEHLGYMYRKGIGTEKNYKQSFFWFSKAVDQGSFYAHEAIGYAYRKGYYVPINYQKAFDHFKIAAENGRANAMGQLGWMYQKGLYVEKNNVLAKEWYKKGKNAGDSWSIKQLQKE